MSKKLDSIQQDIAANKINPLDLTSKSSLAFKNRKSTLLPKISPRRRAQQEDDMFAALQEWMPDLGPIDHIRANKELQSKMPKIKDINLVCQSYKKGSERKQIRVF
jgi:hypothetical protein